jgi:alcohol dehydrogenase class IV
MTFSFYTASKILFEQGALKKIGNEVARYGNNFLIIIDPSFKDSKEKDTLIEQIKSIKADYTVFTEVYGEPTVELVDEVAALALEHHCNVVISMGGGSVIDVGKAVAAVITNGTPTIDYLEYVGIGKKVINEPVPFISIPTTSGTGSEVTKNSVLSDRAGSFKRSMRSDSMVANAAILDPLLAVSCPPKVTACSGIDALTHAIEAFLTFRATPISDGLCIKSIELCGKYLQRCYEDGKDIEAREGMSAAALLAGMAFANSGLGAVHGIAMAVGIACHVGHGESCGILLPHIMRLNAPYATQRMDQIGEILTGRHYSKEGEGAQAAIDYVTRLNAAIGIKPDYKHLNIPRENLREIAEASIGTSMKSNPFQMEIDEWLRFYDQIM